ncbi:MAG: methionine--tRNA ligase [Chitinispirillaceae bacterium]|jgi:methionyl-tRNA synthetase|nr:methionine--tRNA ligase [Chitinispirillaceae bacterium]
MATDTPGRQRYLITMALPYANGDIHLGHLLEAVQTDIFVRYQKLRGNQAVFVCADDTHGTPIEISAMKQKITPEELVATAHKNHVRDYAGFNIGFDIFSSTNSEENRKYAELVFASLQKNGLVVEREINQYFCEHDKRFLPDRFVTGTCPKCKSPNQYGDVCESCGATYQPVDVDDPHCAICGNTPVLRQSTHFYVRLDKCEQFLRDFIATPDVLQADMRNFVTSWINDGLREWCISRDGPYFGFRIPGTENKFFYVWLDAPIGYLSSTERWCTDNGRSVGEFWSPASGTRIVHFIGKDIVYFHALFWPVMLYNAGFSLPSTIFVHGFLNVGGEKMSKSRGTFILAKDFLSKVKHPQAPEYLRFFFGAKLSPNTADIDLCADELVKRVNTTLANNFGNLHHRTFVFCERYFNRKIPDAPWDAGVAAAIDTAAVEIAGCYEAAEFKSVVEKVHALGNMGNKFYQDNKPWELLKTDPAAAASIMVTCANIVKAIAVFLKPMIPEICGSVERQLGTKLSWEDFCFSLRDKPLVVTEKLVIPLTDDDLAPLLGSCAKPDTAGAGLIDIAAVKIVDLRVARIVTAEKVEKSNRLLKLRVELGKEKRQVIAGIASAYAPETLPGKLVIMVANLKPATIMGLQSEGMLLAAEGPKGRPVLLTPDSMIEPGARIS